MEAHDNYIDHYELQALTPDGILSGWTGNSLILLTSAMLFFHICQQKSIKIKGAVNNKLPAYISVALILISIIYNFASLRAFQLRVTQVMGSCKRDPNCPDSHVKLINNMKIRDLILGYFLMFIECLVAYLIFFSL